MVNALGVDLTVSLQRGTVNNNSKKELLIAWQERAIRANLAHYLQAEECSLANSILTIFNLLSAISVLFLVNNIALKDIPNSQLWLPIASLLVVLSTALHYVLKLDQKIYDHKTAGNKFTEIKRKIEIILCKSIIDEADIINIERLHNQASQNHGLVRARIWNKINPRLEQAKDENEDFISSLSGEN